MVTVDYDTGDSFSTTRGKLSYVNLFADIEKAEACVKEIKSGIKARQFEFSYKTESGKVIKDCANWIGYFESVNHVGIEEVSLIK